VCLSVRLSILSVVIIIIIKGIYIAQVYELYNNNNSDGQSSKPAVFKLGSADQRWSATGSHGVRERIPKSSKCLHVFFTILVPYVFRFVHISQSLSLSALRGSVAVVWHDRLSVVS